MRYFTLTNNLIIIIIYIIVLFLNINNFIKALFIKNLRFQKFKFNKFNNKFEFKLFKNI
jgi:hypothetical protein